MNEFLGEVALVLGLHVRPQGTWELEAPLRAPSRTPVSVSVSVSNRTIVYATGMANIRAVIPFP